MSELGGRIPGNPGIIVKGITYTEKSSVTSSGLINTVKKTAVVLSYKGKGEALSTSDGKYIRHTAVKIPDDEALKLYNKNEYDFTVKSNLAVKVNTTQNTTDENGNKTVKNVERTVRLSGTVKTPYFKRLPEYKALGEVHVKGRVDNLSDEHIDEFIKLTEAMSKSDKALQAKYEITNILAGITENSTNSVVDKL